MSAAGQLLHIGRRSKEVPRERWSHLRPTTAQLYVENRCHLRCEHCYESEVSHPHVEGLSLEEYGRLFDELAQLGVLFVTLTGGEIFLRRDLLDLVALARKKRFAVTLYTSGTHIDERKADRLAELQVHSVHVSVYSHDPAVHDGFTGIPGSHARSVRALKLLGERGVQTVLKANLTRFNIDHIDELLELARSVGAAYQLDPTVRARMDGDRAPLEHAVPPETLRRLVLSRPDLAPLFRSVTAEGFCSGEGGLVEDVMCGAARETISIGADGGVSACGFFPVAAGNLKQGSLLDIWYTSPQLDEVRRTSLSDMKECGGCEVKSTCVPCMAQALIERGDTRACNDASRQLATAYHLTAQRKARANEKMELGRALPILGERTMTPASPIVRGGLSTEP